MDSPLQRRFPFSLFLSFFPSSFSFFLFLFPFSFFSSLLRSDACCSPSWLDRHVFFPADVIGKWKGKGSVLAGPKRSPPQSSFAVTTTKGRREEKVPLLDCREGRDERSRFLPLPSAFAATPLFPELLPEKTGLSLSLFRATPKNDGK